MGNQDAADKHTIRLASAWEPPSAGGGVWLRRFGRPAGIEPGDRVLLVVETPAIAALTLNATPLPAPPAGATRWSHDITAILGDRNALSLAPCAGCGDGTAEVTDAHGRAPLPAQYGIVTLQILTLPAARR